MEIGQVACCWVEVECPLFQNKKRCWTWKGRSQSAGKLTESHYDTNLTSSKADNRDSVDGSLHQWRCKHWTKSQAKWLFTCAHLQYWLQLAVFVCMCARYYPWAKCIAGGDIKISRFKIKFLTSKLCVSHLMWFPPINFGLLLQMGTCGINLGSIELTEP